MRGTLLAAIALVTLGAAAPSSELARSRAEASRVTITRDDWGIAHVHGVDDADAVFGAIYAQAEDDFPRIEANYLTALGRTAEADGEGAIWADLRQRLWVDPVKLQADYRASPAWLRALMDAWADGLNFYLATHPGTHPRVLTRFEPWMALSFTEGSIGGDIERVDVKALAAFYGEQATPAALADARRRDAEPKGSNGIAIGPGLSASGHPLLLINPHTSFFFRSELGMQSDAGLHSYGISTWGQFFIYQGWNERLGWMHTSSGVDAVDEFAETVTRGPNLVTYRFGTQDRPIDSSPVTLRFRKSDGGWGERTFTTYRTRHGPVVRSENGRWISVALMNRPVEALEQSWLRTTAHNQAEYLRFMALRANSSNNTVYADADGHTALWLPQFVPQRNDTLFDFRRPVDGSDRRADWYGLTPLERLPQVRDPAAGWLYNSNDAPWRAAGADSPQREAFPRYMDQAGANARGDHATALLARARVLTPAGLRAIAYDPAMPMFDAVLPKALAAYDAAPARYRSLAEAVALLRGWDRRWSAASEPTTLANYWAERLWARGAKLADPPNRSATDVVYGLPGDVLLQDLAAGQADVVAAWGRLRVPWGEVNRFQRNDAAIVQRFDDAKPSIPVPFASARWGSLASFGAKPYPGTRRWYGTSGNSFVAVVEFGPRVRAWAVTAGGESGHPESPHFRDQATRYAAGDLRPVYFWPDELAAHVERRYRPGE